MRLLDLFCGAGGAAMGYARAGFTVVGVDIEPQPHYPFEFHRWDALTFPLGGFDVVHASPLCQAHSVMRFATGRQYPDLIPAVRRRLQQLDVPWIIENVPGARLPGSFVLCGTMFGLEIVRHRRFEVHPDLFDLLPPCSCRNGTVDGRLIAFRHGKPAPGRRHPPRQLERDFADACGVTWMTGRESRQAVPPAYTEWIGRRLIHLS